MRFYVWFPLIGVLLLAAALIPVSPLLALLVLAGLVSLGCGLVAITELRDRGDGS